MTDEPDKREERITVVVVDDHAVVRGGLTQLLAGVADLSVVGTAADGAEALEVVRRTRPDGVLMDLQMPGVDGVSATRSIVAEQLADVLVLTSYADAERIVGALDAGAVGYLLKDAEPDDILDGIRAVARGESPIHPRAARELLVTRRPSADVPDLTPREREVLALVREGLANKQIARRLGITERTVKAHLTSIFATIGVGDRTSAVGGAASGLTRFSGTGGGVPPHAGQTALNEHQSQARDRFGCHSRTSSARRMASHSALTLRSVASRSSSSGS